MASLQQTNDSSQASALLAKFAQQQFKSGSSAKDKKSDTDFASLLAEKTSNRREISPVKSNAQENASLTFTQMKKFAATQDHQSSAKLRDHDFDSAQKNSAAANDFKKSAADKSSKSEKAEAKNEIDKSDLQRAEEFSKAEKSKNSKLDKQKIVEQIDPAILQTNLPGVTSEQLVSLLGLAEAGGDSITPVEGEDLLAEAKKQGLISASEDSEQTEKGMDLLLQAMKNSESEGTQDSAEDLNLKLAEDKNLELPTEISPQALTEIGESVAQKAPENFAAGASLALDQQFAAQVKKQTAEPKEHAHKLENQAQEETKSSAENLTQQPVEMVQNINKNADSSAQQPLAQAVQSAQNSATSTPPDSASTTNDGDENLAINNVKNNDLRASEWTKIAEAKPADTLSQQRQEAVLAQVKMGIENAQKKGERFISIELSPRDLGTIDVQMRVSKEGRTTVQIAADRAETLSLLQRESGTLKAMLQDTLKADTSMLNFTFHQSDGQSGQQAFDQAMQRQNSPWQTPQQKALTAELNEVQQWRIRAAESGRLDLRV
jgi:hypothetical protein